MEFQANSVQLNIQSLVASARTLDLWCLLQAVHGKGGGGGTKEL